MDFLPAQPPRLTATEIDTLHGYGKPVEYRVSTTLMEEGTQSTHALLLRAGLTKIIRRTPGEETRLLAFRGAGDLVGEFGSIDGAPRAATVVAATKLVATRIPAEALRRALHQHASLNASLLRIMIARVREADSGFTPFVAAQDRVIAALTRFAVSCAQTRVKGPVIVPVNQRELAGAAGVERKSACAALKELRSHYLVETRRAKIIVHDLLRLISFQEDRCNG